MDYWALKKALLSLMNKPTVFQISVKNMTLKMISGTKLHLYHIQWEIQGAAR